MLSNEISAKEKEQADYEKQIEIIQQARAKLVELGDDKLKVFTEKMNFLAGYWTRTTADAREVEKWLKSGAKFAVWFNDLNWCLEELLVPIDWWNGWQKFPEYMKLNLDHSVSIC